MAQPLTAVLTVADGWMTIYCAASAMCSASDRASSHVSRAAQWTRAAHVGNRHGDVDPKVIEKTLRTIAAVF